MSEKSEIDHRPRPIRWIAAGVIAIVVVAAVVVLRDPSPPDSPATIAESDEGQGDRPLALDEAPGELTEGQQGLLQDPIRDRFWSMMVSTEVAAVVVDPAVQERGPMFGPYGDDESWSMDDSCPWLLAFADHSGGRNAVRIPPGEGLLLDSGLTGSTNSGDRTIVAVAPPQPDGVVNVRFDNGPDARIPIFDEPVIVVAPHGTSDISVSAAGIDVPLTAAVPAFGSLGNCVPPNLRSEVSPVREHLRRRVGGAIRRAFDHVIPDDPTDDFVEDGNAVEEHWTAARSLSMAQSSQWEPDIELVVAKGEDFWGLYTIPEIGIPRVWAKVVDIGDGKLRVTIESLCELVRFAGQTCPET